jgi:hypothetical protein
MCELRGLSLIDSCGQIDRQNSTSPALLTIVFCSDSWFMPKVSYSESLSDLAIGLALTE